MSATQYAGVAGTWTMELASAAPPAERYFTTDATTESLFDPDYRTLVDDNDIRDGGKYRSIVKLQMRYEGQSPDDTGYSMGTGWLISPNTMVTAGHNVFDWSGLGRAVHIKCHIGYHGKASLNSPIVQSRVAKTIVTPAEWLTSRDNRHRDVAFIQVDRPFTGNLRPFSYKATPIAGDDMLGVVGYPADKTMTDDHGVEEKGAEMWEQFNDSAYTLAVNKSNPLGVLKYRISTFGGQSGAPVVRKSGNKVAVIGTHVYGGGDKNQASTIGPQSNDYDTLLKVFSSALPIVGDYQGIKLVKHQGAGAANGTNGNPTFNNNVFTPVSGPNDVQLPGNQDEQSAESFWDDFKKVASVVGNTVGNAIPVVSPILGPIGGPLAAIVGTTLGEIITRAESFSTNNITTPPQGATERAILAESSLQSVLKMEDSPTTRKILTGMQRTYTAHVPNIKAIALKIAPSLKTTAIKITNTTSYVQKNQGVRRILLEARPLPGLNNAESASSDNQSDFLTYLTQPTRPLEGEPESWGFLSDVLNKGIKIATPILAPSAKASVSLLTNLLTESASDGVTPDDISAAELVTQRALMGEAALQSISKLPKNELEQIRLLQSYGGAESASEGDLQEESFGSFFKGVTQKISDVVRKTAPEMVRVVAPIVASVGINGQMNGGGFLGLPEGRVLQRRPSSSVLDMLHDGTLAKAASQVSDDNEKEEMAGEVTQLAFEGRLPRLEYLRLRALIDGPDSNEDGLVFQEL